MTERWRSTSKFLFRRTQGQVNSLGPWHYSLFNWMEIWMWPPPLGRHVSLLKLPSIIIVHQKSNLVGQQQGALPGQQRLSLRSTIVRALREDQPLRLLLNLVFYHFNHSEPTYKSQRIKLLDVIAACNQLNVNALNLISMTILSWGRSHKLCLFESKFLIAGKLFVQRIFFMFL